MLNGRTNSQVHPSSGVPRHAGITMSWGAFRNSIVMRPTSPGGGEGRKEYSTVQAPQQKRPPPRAHQINSLGNRSHSMPSLLNLEGQVRWNWGEKVPQITWSHVMKGTRPVISLLFFVFTVNFFLMMLPSLPFLISMAIQKGRESNISFIMTPILHLYQDVSA